MTEPARITLDDIPQGIAALSDSAQEAASIVAGDDEVRDLLSQKLAATATGGMLNIHPLWEIVDTVREKIEGHLQRNLMSETASNDNAHPASRDYYSQPIAAARQFQSEFSDIGTKLQSNDLSRLFVNDLGIKPIVLTDIQQPADLEKIGSQFDFISALFWEEINSINHRQSQWNPGNRFQIMTEWEPPEQQRFFRYTRDTVGHLIHGLLAKDITDQWAYYHMLVEEENSQAFLAGLASEESIDLENYGFVLLSTYQRSFRNQISSIAHKKLLSIVDKYTALSLRAKTYSYDPSPYEGFRTRRLWNAMADTGSREAFVKDLAATMAESAIVPGPPKLFDDADYPYDHRLDLDVSERVCTLVHEQSLNASDLAFIVAFLTGPTEARLVEFLSSVRAIVQYLGGDTRAFQRFAVILSGSRRFTSPEHLAFALDLLTERQFLGSAIRSLFRQFLSIMGFGSENDLHSDTQHHIVIKNINARLGGISWLSLLRDIALFNIINYIASNKQAGDFIPLLLSCTCYTDRDDNINNEKLLTLCQSLSAQIAARKMAVTISSENPIETFGLTLSSNIVKKLILLTHRHKSNSLEYRIIRQFISNGAIIHLQALSSIGAFIETKDDRYKREFIEGLLIRSLTPIFDEVSYPDEQRKPLVNQITGVLLAKALPSASAAQETPALGRWTAKVGTGDAGDTPLWAAATGTGDTPPAFIQTHYIEKGLTRVDVYRRDPGLLKALYAWAKDNPLPEGFDLQPPLWSDAKQPGDTPPAFIQRHYALWLGKGGLLRSDIRHTDPQLYMALSNFQRKNKLPEGFDALLPIKREIWPYDPSGEMPPEIREASRIAARWGMRRSRAAAKAHTTML